SMFEASLATFALGSVFLNRAAFDLVYHLFAIVIVFGILARKQMTEDEERIRLGRKGQGQSSGDPLLDAGLAVSQASARPKFRRVALGS
ncbi:MAG TPA: hypothetical protein PLJ12_06810, partial [Planctomycetota bacterium]|nr:hypothetical protein [Planctomycetota bacterium]